MMLFMPCQASQHIFALLHRPTTSALIVGSSCAQEHVLVCKFSQELKERCVHSLLLQWSFINSHCNKQFLQHLMLITNLLLQLKTPALKPVNSHPRRSSTSNI